MTSLILTGTIIPQANFVHITDYKARRLEYLNALKFYKQFGEVFFIENSSYELFSDIEFSMDNVTLIKAVEDANYSYSLGKGYQEFRMLDQFICGAHGPQQFFKITGRRIVKNFSRFKEAYQISCRPRFDIHTKYKIVDTSFFYCTRQFYLSHIKDAYMLANDEKGDWIEKVLFKRFIKLSLPTMHSFQPLFLGCTGTSGESLVYPSWKLPFKNAQRYIFTKLNRTHF